MIRCNIRHGDFERAGRNRERIGYNYGSSDLIYSACQNIRLRVEVGFGNPDCTNKLASNAVGGVKAVIHMQVGDEFLRRSWTARDPVRVGIGVSGWNSDVIVWNTSLENPPACI